ncbi:hypothetical protein I4U23_021538 [Adineta vaga]|nr:hypothetical protein I4U23_021538 [Adineta vaga]
MGSEGLSHKFTAKDPTFKGKIAEDDKSSSHNSMFHTPGTQPVSLSNGSTSSSTVKIKRKSHSKYTKLYKLYRRQLSHIETTLNAIESLSKSSKNDQNQILFSTRKHVDELNEKLENYRNVRSPEDHKHFDSIKHDIEQLIDDLKFYKMNSNDSDSNNTIDYLVGFPLDVSNSDDDEDETLVYF